MPPPIQEKPILSAHFEKCALRQGLSIMPASAESRSLAQLLDRVGMNDGRMVVDSSQAEYICGPMRKEIRASLQLALDSRFGTLEQVMEWICEKLEGLRPTD